MLRSHGGDLLGVAAGGDDGVTGGQGRFGDVDAHAPTGSGDEPNLLLSHAGVLLLLDPQVVQAPPYRWCTATEPRVGRLREPLTMGLLTGTLYLNGSLAVWKQWHCLSRP